MFPTMRRGDPAYAILEQRLGRAHLTQRLETERYYTSKLHGGGLSCLSVECIPWLHGPLRVGLRLLGLYGRGQRNARNPVVRHHVLVIEDLPPAFEGLVLLQLSDLHLDISPSVTDAIAAAVQGVTYDLCVITGDFRCRTLGAPESTVAEMARLRPALRGEIYAVLGNHDCLDTVLPIEATGVRMLLNEAVPLRRAGQTLYLAGIDDAHYYETDNIQKAAVHLDRHARGILLSHTPEVYRQAAACGFSAMLCGHTHGGQICAPGGIPLVINSGIPLRFSRGPWRFRGMRGYTSAGTGCSGVDVRFWCPPEITLHTLSAGEPRCGAEPEVSPGC